MGARLLRYLTKTGRRLSVMQMIALSFAGIALVGTVLLMLPVAARGERVSFFEALFTAVSATCVTGLTLGDVYETWSGFGQTVILLLFQLGALGFMTIFSGFFFLLRRNIGMKQRMMIAQTLNLNDLEGAVRIMKHVIVGTLLLEAVGAVILTVRFAFDYPFATALKWGVFHAVSAFCNAGFDIWGEITPGIGAGAFMLDPCVNLTVIVLTLMGGLGFFVWEDLIHSGHARKLSVHSRLALSTSLGLLLIGWAAFCLLEWNNPLTYGSLDSGEKLLVGLFQSVMCRSTGFTSVAQEFLTDSSKMLTGVLMFVGGSPGSTAGGVKTVTIAVLFLAAVNTAKGRKTLHVYRRSIAQEQINQAMAIVMLVLALDLLGAVLISTTEQLGFVDAAFVAVSALSTAGLSLLSLDHFHLLSRILLLVYMFLGRVGILSLSLGFLMKNHGDEGFEYALTRVLIG